MAAGTTDAYVHQPIRIAIMRVMLLRANKRHAAHSETSSEMLQKRTDIF